MKIIYGSIIFISAMLLSLTAAAQPQTGMGLGAGRWIAEELDLTAEQIDALSCENAGQGRELKEKIAVERKLLNDMLRKADVSDQIVEEQLELVNQVQNDFNRFRLQKMLRARKVLNPEQLEKLMKMKGQLAESGQGRGCGHAKRHGHGPGCRKEKH